MPVDGDFGDEPSEPIDQLVIALRAYVRKAPKKPKKGSKPPRTTLPGALNWRDLAPRTTPSDWVQIFDCETRTTPDQRLRFGGYQLRYKGEISERGAFYEPDVLSEDELAILRQFIAEEESNSDGERICLRTRAEFVDEVFYQSGQAVGAQIVGFNLPFDLSRLAIRHASARRSMKGGFSLTLSENWPPIAVKHLSQRAALIRFTGDRPTTETAAEEESDDDLEFMEAETQFSTLNARVREVVILTCGAFWNAKYELYAHSALARRAGLSEQSIRALATGQPPEAVNADETLAHDFTRQLITEHNVSQDLYSRAAATFGTAELVNMTFLIGHYLLTSAVLNTFETPAPDQQADITKKG
jgi:alkylhydroperoxidase family enzyme